MGRIQQGVPSLSGSQIAVPVVIDEAESVIRRNGRLADSRHLKVRVAGALASRPVSECRHHRRRQAALGDDQDESRSTPVLASPRFGAPGQSRRARNDRPVPGWRMAAKARGGLPSKIILTMAGSAEFGRLC